MIGAVETHTETFGEGPPIILLHGFTGDTTTMRGLSDSLDGCGRRILVDLIGHGKSDAPHRHSYPMDEAVQQVRSLAETLDEPPVLIGYSLGGRVAISAAVNGMSLRGLVTIGGRAGIADPEERTLRRFADDALADDIEEKGIAWFVDHWANRPFYASQKTLGSSHLAESRTQRLGNSCHALAASLRGMGVAVQEPLGELLPRIDTPTLVMVGELDVRFRECADQLLCGIPNAELAVVPIAGHAAHLEAPSETARAIRGFLTRI